MSNRFVRWRSSTGKGGRGGTSIAGTLINMCRFLKLKRAIFLMEKIKNIKKSGVKKPEHV